MSGKVQKQLRREVGFQSGTHKLPGNFMNWMKRAWKSLDRKEKAKNDAPTIAFELAVKMINGRDNLDKVVDAKYL